MRLTQELAGCILVFVVIAIAGLAVSWLSDDISGGNCVCVSSLLVGFMFLVLLRTDIQPEPTTETSAPARPNGVSIEDERSISPNVRQAVLDRDDYICRYCGRRSQTMEVDHVSPMSRGGMSTLDNLVTACRECNRKKSSRTPEEAGMTVLPVRTQTRRW